MKSALEVVKLSADYLAQRGIAHPRRQAEEIVSTLLGINRLDLYVDHDRPLTEPEIEQCRSWLQRRGRGEPLPYLSGKVEFYQCALHVTSAVLIPRQETEILVDKVVQELKTHELANKVLWDVCCGSGCIGIALKKQFPALDVTLSDLSPAALHIARENAQTNQVEVSFLEGDLLQPFKGKADYIVCNPPYIAEDEIAQLENEVRNHEPRLALVGGPTGVEFYERLAKELPRVLKPGGRVWLEIGSGQGSSLKKLFSQGPWKETRVEKDWASHERFFFLSTQHENVTSSRNMKMSPPDPTDISS